MYNGIVEAMVRKWGNSVGVVFPSNFVKENDLKVNDMVNIVVVKKADLRHVFGSLPRKMSGQEFKDEARKGWK
jgi:antitoxin component of MazEF toxin-antitoxin module